MPRIMVVDDDLDLVETLTRSLRKMRYDVIGMTDGKEALDRLKDDHHEIDLMVTDYRMPNMNGLQLLRNLRKENIFLPVVLMTGYADKRLVEDFMNSGGNGYIEKSFLMEDMAQIISKAMKKP